jgi:uncharacterized protein (TIGR00299 family) protein
MTGRHLHFDCYSGAAGNMLLGALLDLGVPRRTVRQAIGRLGLEPVRMYVEEVHRGALAALHVRFAGGARTPRERRWRTIRQLLRRSELPPGIRERSLQVFEQLAQAEGRVHGISPDRVHFHEVGAVDALCDIVGVCAAVEHLAPERITASSLALGRGVVETEHGTLPLPAPATLELLSGLPTHPLDVVWETVTPTGAALLRVLVDEFGSMPALRPDTTGYGAGGDRDGPLPNTLRAVLGQTGTQLGRDRVSVIEANLDDMSPEQLPFLLERLMDAGALDASLAPISMKKGRQGQLLRVIARPSERDALARRILLDSTSLGVRFREETRFVLPREVRTVETSFGRIRVKLARDPDGRVSASAEYESCARAARRTGAPLHRVYREAEARAVQEPD